MLEKVLQAEHWPDVSVTASLSDNQWQASMLEVVIGLHGVRQRMELPVKLQISDDQLQVQGSFPLDQTDFGMEPYSAFAGALRVRDRIEINFSLAADRFYFDPP